jgi:truncated hemoglobin YjbI
VLGGRHGVGLIVDGLYDRLERDRELARLFRSHRSGERKRLKEFFETIFGGEVRGIRDVGVQRRHIHRLISADESARWLVHFGAAMDQGGIAERTQAAVMDLLRGPAARVVNDGALKQALKQALMSAGKGDVDAVAALVAEHPGLIDQRGADGVTMLWTAARRGRLPLVRWLVARGADVEIPGSAVHVTQVMVSPYCIAVRSRRAQVPQYLVDHGAHVDVFCAAFLGDLDTLRGHIVAGLANAPSPHEDFHPVTPLHHAVWTEDLSPPRSCCSTVEPTRVGPVDASSPRPRTRARSNWCGCSSTMVPRPQTRRASAPSTPIERSASFSLRKGSI